MPQNKQQNIQQGYQLSQIEKYFSQCDKIAYQPDIFPLGYHVRRTEPRLIYVMPITMVYEGLSIPVKSKNFSATGLQVFIPRSLIQEGKIVQLTFDKFNKEYSPAFGEQPANFDSIDYLIKTVQHAEQKTYISLIQKNLSEATIEYFRHFIIKNRLRYKIDATDRIYASKAQYYENLYTNNMQHVPMFIRWNKTNGLYIDTLVKTEKNLPFFNYLNDDISPFYLPQRIEKFVELARQHQSALFFSYWIKNDLYTIFDFEIQSKNDLFHVVKIVNKLKGRVYKVSANLNKKPTHEKITSMLSKIQALDIMESKILDRRVTESIAQIVLTDISQVYFRHIIADNSLKINNDQILSSCVISNNQKIRMSDGAIIEQYDEADFHKPEIINFHIGKQRYDERYHYTMDIEIRYNRQKFSAKTIDFSRSGLGLVIHNTHHGETEPLNIEIGSDIKITFFSLMIKGITTELKHISHRVMISRQTAEGLFLGVIRNTSGCNPKVNHFFSDLVKRSKDTLELCVKDKTDNIYSSFYEAFFTENIETIPIVIARDREHHHYVREIGLTNPPCKLAEKLYLKNKGYIFRFLTTRLRLDELHQRAIKSSEQKSQAFMLFIFKGKNSQGQENLFSVTDFEIIKTEDLEKIIKIVLQNNGVCIRIQFINHLLVDNLFRKMTIDKVNLLNKSSAKLLTKEYQEIIGFAEMIDLTNEYQQQYAL